MKSPLKHRILQNFLQKGLKGYKEKRNDPTITVLSNLSPYFHYGRALSSFSPNSICTMPIIYTAADVCTATVALRARELKVHNSDDFKAFFEESVVRKEHSDNVCSSSRLLLCMVNVID